MLQLFPIQLFGMTLKGLDSSNDYDYQLGKLRRRVTNDGSISLYNENYKEGFHCNDGALQETVSKFFKPSELDRLKNADKVSILDVCIGLGYNTATLLNDILLRKQPVDWWGLEIDKRPLDFAIKNKILHKFCTTEVITYLERLSRQGSWEQKDTRGKVLWGDARVKIKDIPTKIKFDLILLDPFSPQKCPQLWNQEFLGYLSNKLSRDGRLITYCTASAIRKSLIKEGLKIFSILPTNKSNSKWSAGTIAINQKNNENMREFFKPLSKMELEHLETKSSVPYRDPTGMATKDEILMTRVKEQSQSILENTSSWKKRWKLAESA